MCARDLYPQHKIGTKPTLHCANMLTETIAFCAFSMAAPLAACLAASICCSDHATKAIPALFGCAGNKIQSRREQNTRFMRARNFVCCLLNTRPRQTSMYQSATGESTSKCEMLSQVKRVRVTIEWQHAVRGQTSITLE